MNNAICIISLKPNEIWCKYLDEFKKYKVFYIIDDCHFNYNELQKTYKNINFIKIQNKKCKDAHYSDMNFILKKKITGWEKAMYYFGVENKNFDYIWFIEDDVFFYNEDTIINIDKKYVKDDLLSNIYYENIDGKKNYWHWKKININYSPPYYCAMVCAVRLSRQMLQCVYNYATENKTLFFLEALFPTLAKKNNLIYNTPDELSNIYYDHKHELKDINKFCLYHPVKKIDDHIIFRKSITDHNI